MGGMDRSIAWGVHSSLPRSTFLVHLMLLLLDSLRTLQARSSLSAAAAMTGCIAVEVDPVETGLAADPMAIVPDTQMVSV